MTLRDWFADRARSRQLVDSDRIRREMPDGLWTKCNHCSAPLYNKDLEANLQVCPKCGYHFRVSAWTRIGQLVDEGTFSQTHASIRSTDPLGFVDTKPYKVRLEESYDRLGDGDGVITGAADIEGTTIQLAVMDFAFMGGSMGSAVGEKITRTIEDAHEAHRPLIIVTASGGARMQEGTLSLMQMAKTSSALAQFAEGGGLYLAILADPTTGGVSASFATLADILISEPAAVIGFAGRRVIEQTIRQKAPPEFQTAEWLLKYGALDMIVPRSSLRPMLGQLLRMHAGQPATVA